MTTPLIYILGQRGYAWVAASGVPPASAKKILREPRQVFGGGEPKGAKRNESDGGSKVFQIRKISYFRAFQVLFCPKL